MNPNEDKQQIDERNKSNTRRIRRGPNRGHGSMPEPDNVVSTVTASVPTFRAMAVQNRGPQLMMPSTPVVAKVPAVAPSPYYESKMKQTEAKERENLVLNTEMQDRHGWNTSQIQIQNLPMYFPDDMIQWEFASQHLPDVLGRISNYLRESSVQACFIETPLSAKLQTCRENAELYLVFFNKPSGMVSMSVQRHKGDSMAATQCIRRLVDAAKGILGDSDGNCDQVHDSDATVSAKTVLAMERLIERCAAESAQGESQDNYQNHPFLNQTPEQITASAIREVHGWLEQSNRLDLRRRAFEYLLAITDLKRTMSSTAIATATIVLQGGVPGSTSTELNTHAKKIRSVLLSVLLIRELPGDRAMFAETGSNESSSDDDIEMRPYFPEMDENVTAASTGLPQHYTDYMNELFHLALRIFVQSLEVLCCFRKPHSQAEDDPAKDLFAMAKGKDLYDILLGCVCHAESKLANGYLACKALRLLASNHPDIKDQIKCDENARQSIGNAYQVGGMCHKLLRDESYQLWQCLSQ